MVPQILLRGRPADGVFCGPASAKLAVEPRSSVVVEDSTAGIEAAVRAGMAPIALVGTTTRERLAGAGAALVVDSLRELSPDTIAGLINNE